ncbi:DUF4309 domain-containing protein [Paenibacillus filicis]|uniref:DUF4309 domain-containing protein n=1 Tax=Paenibacillus gyeongsangnamensis TaxID=3388067 RepID=A0ABT4QCB6_9BACL|nr:DUF4309 domain-containing protein [Paenibacillus filicis]MCZ8514315.1 DUF4309 domain-containing protein [Paenibacillus filicis]
MMILKKTIVIPMLVTSMMMFTACTSSVKPLSNTGGQATADAPASTPAPSPSSTSIAPTPVSAQVPDNSSSAAKPDTTPVKSSAASASGSVSASVSDQIKRMLESAQSGKVEGIAFAAKTNVIDDVEKAWGQADKKDWTGSRLYAIYSKKNAAFGFNKGSQIIDVRSYDPKLHTLTLKQIEQTLGKPADTKVNGNDNIYIYQASDTFQLKFIIPKTTGYVDHISVFDTKDSVNYMVN